MNTQEEIKKTIELCERHVKRLRWAMKKVKTFLPLTSEKLLGLNDEQVAIFEVFTNRFGKLQDAMGTKLFAPVLNFVGEEEYPTIIDKLHRLQKIGALPEELDWMSLRKTRNHFSHDYPEDDDTNANTLNIAYVQAEILLFSFEGLKTFIEGYFK